MPKKKATLGWLFIDRLNSIFTQLPFYFRVAKSKEW